MRVSTTYILSIISVCVCTQLHYIGELCGLMPGSESGENNTALIDTLVTGITPVTFEGDVIVSLVYDVMMM